MQEQVVLVLQKVIQEIVQFFQRYRLNLEQVVQVVLEVVKMVIPEVQVVEELE